MTIIHISQIKKESYKWIPTWGGYREIERFGNHHAKFIDLEWLEIHWDEHNATSFPTGTINHLAKWVNENTGINEDVIRLAGGIGLAAVGIKILQKL
ncbi:MAG: hypothetical protein IIA83_06650 [Thaumarchaeota archaeon]|nr:hypothetical protein [Nitrososphaerota archaeon]